LGFLFGFFNLLFFLFIFPLLLLFKILIFVGGWIAACIISVCRGGLDFCRGFIVVVPVVVATTLVFVPCGF